MPLSLLWPLSALSHVKGLHLNIALVLRNVYILTFFLGRRLGRLFGYTERDLELLYPFKKTFYTLMRESGYMHIQSTKPDTVGEGARGRPSPPGVGMGGWGGHLRSVQQGSQPGGLTHPQGHCSEVAAFCERLRALSTLNPRFSTDVSDTVLIKLPTTPLSEVSVPSGFDPSPLRP